MVFHPAVGLGIAIAIAIEAQAPVPRSRFDRDCDCDWDPETETEADRDVVTAAVLGLSELAPPPAVGAVPDVPAGGGTAGGVQFVEGGLRFHFAAEKGRTYRLQRRGTLEGTETDWQDVGASVLPAMLAQVAERMPEALRADPVADWQLWPSRVKPGPGGTPPR